VEEPVFGLSWDPDRTVSPEDLLSREWLLTNGKGGYASGTLSGVPTRRYHGLLIAALPAPFGRQVLFNHLGETVLFKSGASINLGASLTYPNAGKPESFRLTEFRLESGLPTWRYEKSGCVIERRILMLHEQNTIHIRYSLLNADEPIRIRLRPSIHFRPHEDPAQSEPIVDYQVKQEEGRFEIVHNTSQLPPLRLHLFSERTFVDDALELSLIYREEKNRGYAFEGRLWTPGYFETEISPEHGATLVASCEAWETIVALSPEAAFESELERRVRLLGLAPDANTDYQRQLIFAADQFVISPVGRVEDTARARALGEQPRSVVAGYHWFTDWGRDTMISLEGLTLLTGRRTEARWILHTFALHLRNGLIPNLFPEGAREGLYHTADATLWFFHALERYLHYTDDREFLKSMLPKMVDIVNWHRRGTDFGIGMDEKDFLLRQGAEGYQLTWMDAKVGDWVVTPRRGKAVEINALWYNALRTLESWLKQENDFAALEEIGNLAENVRRSFNERFWNESAGFLYDVIDAEGGGNDPACRPNQIFSISLPYPVLTQSRWLAVLDVVEKRLLTPVGLRSLDASHPDYKPTYFGDLRTRDAAYHQGTVWAWLIGPFIDAWVKARPEEKNRARSFLDGLLEHLNEAGLGTISEVFDAEAPYTPRGCIAQAWSVAEVLRCLSKLDAIARS